MKAFILAAGRGERMRPLTDHTPKPLLPVGGKPLIAWHLERLAAAGFTEVVINYAHLGEKIEGALGDGSQWGLRIRYSPEPPGALETAGGIANALPLLGNDAFLVVNGDVYCDIDFGRFSGLTLGPAVDSMVAAGNQPVAHLVMVANPAHHADGDFNIDGQRITFARCGETLTYAGIAVFSPSFFADVPRGSVMKLYPLLAAAIAAGTLTGEHHSGRWVDVGTPQRLAELDAELTKP
ncbi:MAG: nucleotidyltransferase family protein [Dechloromonas sp.]|nr:nucleotidyltransferase family protein [Dechloromonas sp.]